MTTVGKPVGQGMSIDISKERQVPTLFPIHVQKQRGATERPPRARGRSRGLPHRQFLAVLPSHLWEHCCFSMSKGSENSNDLITTIIFTLTKGQTSLKTVTGWKCSVLFKKAETLQIGVIWTWPEPSELEFYTGGHLISLMKPEDVMTLQMLVLCSTLHLPFSTVPSL